MKHVREILYRLRVALLTTLVMLGIIGFIVAIVAIAVHISLPGATRTTGGSSEASVTVALYVCFLATVVATAYVAIGIAERASGVWRTKLFRALFAKAMALMFVCILGGIGALDLFVHDLHARWLRVETDSDVRLLSEIGFVALCASFVWQLGAMLSSFGFSTRKIVLTMVAIILGSFALFGLLVALGHAGTI